MSKRAQSGVHAVLDADDVSSVLRDKFYRAPPAVSAAERGPRKAKPDHYEVICISMYCEDLARLDAKVAELKRQGHRKMNRSALIRFALDHADTSRLARSY